MRRIFLFLHNKSGATAIEYSLIAGLISIAIVGSTRSIGSSLSSSFSQIVSGF
jgi:pilus assembly protein Flp/PilA